MRLKRSSKLDFSHHGSIILLFCVVQIILFGSAILATRITSLDVETSLMVTGALIIIIALPSIGAQRPPVNAMSCAVGRVEKTVKQTQWDRRSTIIGISIGIVPLLIGIVLSL